MFNKSKMSSYIEFSEKTQKYNVYLYIYPNGIKSKKKILIETFDNENCARAGVKVAQAIMNNHHKIFQIPSNEQINNWISSNLNY